MVNLGVRIGDIQLANPVMPASGTFAPELGQVIDLNRLGALVTKSISRDFRSGNPTPRVAEAGPGMLNSIGIPSKGIDHFLNEVVPALSPLLAAFGCQHICGYAGIVCRTLPRSQHQGDRCLRGEYFLPEPEGRWKSLRDASLI